jgi:hypothetical protein
VERPSTTLHASGRTAPTGTVRLPSESPPILLVVIDTEEEFDWSRDFDRSNTSVGHMRAIPRLQAVFDEFAIRPVYVIDHPIATQSASAEVLRAIHAGGRCEIGAHLHPWVSPPHEEEVGRRNSYPGNLPRELEERKIGLLVEAIEQGLGVRPRSYKAGRYGFGPNTAAALLAHGFEVDLSPCPPFDLAEDGGPDWSATGVDPFWLAGGELLSIPCTGAYVGFAGERGHPLYRLATHPALRWARLPGVLSRLGALERLQLSPEGYLPEHHRRITLELLRRGSRTFTFSLHSPSVQPGCTPYVRTERELVQFLDACRRYFDFFLGELGGVSMTSLELRRHLVLQANPNHAA